MARLGTQADARAALHDVFGHGAFRSGQDTAVNAVVGGRDTIVVLPTGHGKSICYQVPAIVAHRRAQATTLVVSPLIALMQDQVEQLGGRGVAAAALHSQLDTDVYRRVLDQARAGELALLYVSPERASNQRFRALLSEMRVGLLAIDEAHCVSQWGHDFRPDYLRLGELRELTGAPCVALTATATSRVVTEIGARLELSSPISVRGDFARPNLSFRVEHPGRAEQRTQRLCAELDELGLRARSTPGRAIVYCATKKTVDTVAAALRSGGYPAGHYHAGRTALARDRAQRAFETGRTKILVATNAFGMGIDMPDVRLIVHFQTPGSVEAYYQEAGRAGRDGMPARCVMFFGAADMVTQRRLGAMSSRSGAQLDRRAHALDAIERYAFSDVCRQVTICAHFDGEADRKPCGSCDACDPDARADAPAAAPARPAVQALPEDALQTIVNAVDRLRKPVGKTNLARALRGSAAKSLGRGGLLMLPEYGSLSDHDERSVVAAIQALLQDGRLARRGQKYPTVWIPGKAVRGAAADGPRPRKRRARQATSGVGSIAPELDRYRKRMAGRLKWKAYMVFQRKAIMAIDRDRPSTLRDLERIPGLGPAKIERFGEDILALVRRYG